MAERPGGIRAENRALLERLHQGMRGPFTAADAASALVLPVDKARRLLRYLASRGWLDRIRHGVYVVVPLGAHRSGKHLEDPWVVAAVTFGRCFIAGWSAAEHWDLTEQIFRDVLVVTTRRPRKRSVTLQGTVFKLRTLSAEKHFGLTHAWRGTHRVPVSDPTRTVIDLLADPTMGGGIRHVADILEEYMESEHRDGALLIKYSEKLGNRTVFKRLGYLLEKRGVDAPSLIEASLARQSSGTTQLDPSIRNRGRILSRWNLAINSEL